MKRLQRRGQRGLTLTELLVVMLIIGLLATIAVPVYIGRMEDARIRMARGEAREIAQAEETCALIHGYYVPFQVLDDGPADPAFVTNRDNIDQDFLSQLFVINPLIRPQDQLGNQFQLDDNQARIRDMVIHWQGPFLNPQRVYTGTDDPRDINFPTSPYFRLDFPLDPWGNPYRFYSPIGNIGTSGMQVTGMDSLSISFSNGVLTTNDSIRQFERYAVVSFGRNAINDTDASVPVNYRDDVIYLFGTPGVESQFGLRI